MRTVFRQFPMLLILAGGLQSARAFYPPVTDVEAFVTTNRMEVTVHYQAFDPALGGFVAAKRSYPGNVSSFWVITSLVASNGIVAWTARAAGQFSLLDREIAAAVYDPIAASWREYTRRYQGGTLNVWTLSAPTIAEGVVSWQAIGSGLSFAFAEEIGYATYDVLSREWRAQTHDSSGTASSYWIITNRISAAGMVAWARFNVGQFALGHKEVHYAIFDPLTASWMHAETEYQSRLNDVWTVANLRIANQAVQWSAAHRNETRTESRGYRSLERAWLSNVPTAATAVFAASAATRAAPASLWFIDRSIGATNWTWDFGDGTNSTARSPRHVFDAPGTFGVIQTVAGPSGIHSNSLTVSVEAAPGETNAIVFDTPNVRLTNGELRAPLTGSAATNTVIIEQSTNLVDWVPIATNISSAGTVEVSASVTTNGPGQFFRAVVPR